MKEIGGYMELDQYFLPMLHNEAIALNCGRNCLAYLLQARKIKEILLPKFLCNSIRDVCRRENVKIRYYSISEDFLPEDLYVKQDEWIYLVNYYGQLSNQQITFFSQKYQRIIVDQVQAYFQMPIKNVDTLYSCRKYFGVPDGAFLYTNVQLDDSLQQDQSYRRVNHLLGRYEKSAEEFYKDFISNDKMFEKESIKRMSKLTNNLLHGIQYAKVRDKRTENYLYLYKKFKSINILKLQEIEGAFMYPLFIKNGSEVRKKLQSKKIYIPTLWPDVLESCGKRELEFIFSNNILPLPCDQRYTEEEMEYITGNIMEILCRR